MSLLTPQGMDALATFTGPAVLALVIILILKGDLVTRGTMRMLEAERDAWQTLASEAINLGFAALRSEPEEKADQ